VPILAQKVKGRRNAL